MKKRMSVDDVNNRLRQACGRTVTALLNQSSGFYAMLDGDMERATREANEHARLRAQLHNDAARAFWTQRPPWSCSLPGEKR